MNPELARKLDRAAVAWLTAVNRLKGVVAAQAKSPDPGAQHHELAMDRAVAAKHRAQRTLVALAPRIPMAIALEDVLVVISPTQADAEDFAPNRVDRDRLQVLAIPKMAVVCPVLEARA